MGQKQYEICCTKISNIVQKNKKCGVKKILNMVQKNINYSAEKY